jgi:outer membrane protein assembly factor BamD
MEFIMVQKAIRNTGVVAALAALLIAGGCGKKKYDNPIAKDTQQPDKILFDSAMSDVEHGRYERARLTLQTLMNTYDTSEYLAKAKLLVADSWYREGGTHGFAQAEAEYKDFILFYPQMEEAAEAQQKICDMQYQQMDKSDRDPTHAFRADDECRQLLIQFPNSKAAPLAAQRLRDIQEVLGDREYRVAELYGKKGSYPASANRYQALTDQYPLYSKADEALWREAEDYKHMGDRFEDKQAESYQRIVRDYPLSAHVDEAKSRLEEMKRPIPAADPVAENRMKYEQENRTKKGMLGKLWDPFSSHPDLNNAAKSGTPQMGRLAPTVPASVPPAAAGNGGGTANTVTVSQTPANPDVLDKNPDARLSVTGGANGAQPAATTNATTPPGAGGNGVGTGAAANPANGAAGAKPAEEGPKPDPLNPLAAPATTPQNHTGPAKNAKPAKAPKKKAPPKKKKSDDSTGKTNTDTTKADTDKTGDKTKQ